MEKQKRHGRSDIMNERTRTTDTFCRPTNKLSMVIQRSHYDLLDIGNISNMDINQLHVGITIFFLSRSVSKSQFELWSVTICSSYLAIPQVQSVRLQES